MQSSPGDTDEEMKRLLSARATMHLAARRLQRALTAVTAVVTVNPIMVQVIQDPVIIHPSVGYSSTSSLGLMSFCLCAFAAILVIYSTSSHLSHSL
jgi:hypothetical protein